MGTPSPGPSRSETGEPAPQVTLRRGDDCRWQTPSPPRDGELVVDRKLQLDAGTAELEFAGGVTVLIQGPTEVELQKLLPVVFCVRQVARPRPHTEAAGFTIETTQATIVDLGTEFAVETQADDDLKVYVFRGQVEVEGKPTPSEDREIGGKRVRLESRRSSAQFGSGQRDIGYQRADRARAVRAAASRATGVECARTPMPTMLTRCTYGISTTIRWPICPPESAHETVSAGVGRRRRGMVTPATLGLPGFGKALQLPGPRNETRGAYNAKPQSGPPEQAADNISTETFWNHWADDATRGAFTYESASGNRIQPPSYRRSLRHLHARSRCR